MNSHVAVLDIYIFIMDTHNFIMGKYGWRCISLICSYGYIEWNSEKYP